MELFWFWPMNHEVMKWMSPFFINPDWGSDWLVMIWPLYLKALESSKSWRRNSERYKSIWPFVDEGTKPILSKSSLKDGVMSWNHFDHIFSVHCGFPIPDLKVCQSELDISLSLKELFLSFNPLESLPQSMSQLESLEERVEMIGRNAWFCWCLDFGCFWNYQRNQDSFSVSRRTSCVEVMLPKACQVPINWITTVRSCICKRPSWLSFLIALYNWRITQVGLLWGSNSSASMRLVWGIPQNLFHGHSLDFGWFWQPSTLALKWIEMHAVSWKVSLLFGLNAEEAAHAPTVRPKKASAMGLPCVVCGFLDWQDSIEGCIYSSCVAASPSLVSASHEVYFYVDQPSAKQTIFWSRKLDFHRSREIWLLRFAFMIYKAQWPRDTWWR